MDMGEAIEAVECAYCQFSRGSARVPIRTPVEGDGGVTLVMPAHLEASTGVKLVSVFKGNAGLGLPTIMGLMVLVDGSTGRPLAVMEAGTLTAVRTGASGGVAARYLARPDSRVAALFGAGVQGRTQLLALDRVLQLEEIRVVDVREEAARELIRDLTLAMSEGIQWKVVSDAQEAVKGADVVVAATTSRRPVFSGGWLDPGAHVTGVGSFTPDMQELDPETFGRASRVVVDSVEAAWEEAGDLLLPLREGRWERDIVQAEIGQIIRGTREGRGGPGEITVFKAVGLAVLDVAVATLVWKRARDGGWGQAVDF